MRERDVIAGGSDGITLRPTRGRTTVVLAVAAGIAAAISVACWWSSGPSESLPPAFAARVNPRAHEGAAVAAGELIFRDNCSSCHGDRADGHGVAAVGLVPPPANFRAGDVLPRHSDAYLFYRLTEGKPGTAMPSFRGALSEDERWAVVSYLRSLR
jgi:mono/diheme cytochrome c family protein